MRQALRKFPLAITRTNRSGNQRGELTSIAAPVSEMFLTVHGRDCPGNSMLPVFKTRRRSVLRCSSICHFPAGEGNLGSVVPVLSIVAMSRVERFATGLRHLPSPLHRNRCWIWADTIGGGYLEVMKKRSRQVQMSDKAGVIQGRRCPIDRCSSRPRSGHRSCIRRAK